MRAEDQSFREFLSSSRNLIAPVVSITDASVAEMITYLSPDFLIADMEHSVIDVGALQNIVVASKPIDVVARIRGLEKNEIKKVLDTGVSGIIIPGINTAQETREAISYSRFPPAGIRGAGPVRASGYGYSMKNYLGDPKKAVIIIQIETKMAYESLEEILSVPGLDGCFIGPIDLSTALQIEFSWSNPEFVSAVDRIMEGAGRRDLTVGIYSPQEVKDTQPILDRGFNYLMFGTDREAIQLEYARSINRVRNLAQNIHQVP